MTPTREQVIQWARELGIIPPHPYVVPTDAQLEAVRKFAEKQFAAGQQAERERYEPMQMFNIEKDKQLAAAQAVIAKLRTAYVALENFAQSIGGSSSFWDDMNDILEPASVLANFGHEDDTALREMLAEQWEKAAKVCEAIPGEDDKAFTDHDECAAVLRAEAEKLRKQPAQGGE